MWIERFSRLKSAVHEMAGDPHSQGKAAKVAGIALIADGFVGLENPLDGKSSRRGVFGMLPLILFGAVFTFAGNFVASGSEPYENGVVTAGRVVDVERDSEGLCALVVEYETARQTFRTSSSGYSNLHCDDVGRSVDVSYIPDSPGSARVLDDTNTLFGKMVKWVGWGLIAAAAAFMLLRLAEIISGAVLWFWGRRQMRAHPPTPESDWMSKLHIAWVGGEVQTSPSTDTSPGNMLREAAGTLLGSVPSSQSRSSPAPPAPHAQPLTPPPGWYPEPSSPSGRRWWDGSTWTPHT